MSGILTTSQFEEILRIYTKHLQTIEKINGYPGFNGFSVPGRSHGHAFEERLGKVSFEITKKKKAPSDEEAEAALKAELQRRLENKSEPFFSDVKRYFTTKAKGEMDMYLESIHELAAEHGKHLLTILEPHLDQLWVNEFFQRVKDYQCIFAELSDFEQRVNDAENVSVKA